MDQREVKDNNNVSWTCMQALAGVEGKAAEKATKFLESNNNQVPVICTPTGGAQSVRLSLQLN